MKSDGLPVVNRVQGVTDAERYLHRLCDRSFLSLWSYAGVFRDQRSGGRGHGKEVCDLLVVFGDDVLIFTDKSCDFPDTGQVQLDWSRWFRKAVRDALQQAFGAERWIRENPDRLFLDRACTQPFPLDLPPSDRMRFHHIVVAHNVSARCRQHFGDASGSLVLNTDVTLSHQCDQSRCQPFQYGWMDEHRTFVHVLDDDALEILLHYRDTITDVVRYLRAKEEFLLKLKHRRTAFMCLGEEELLAQYLLTLINGEHGFKIPERRLDRILFDAGDWVSFLTGKQYSAQKEADKVSYAWDALIETFAKHIFDGTSYYASTPRVADRERILRFLAREPRVRRRLLAEALLGGIRSTGVKERRVRVIEPSSSGDPHYCVLLLPRRPGLTEERYRAARMAHLHQCVCVTKLMFPDAVDIVGLATEPGIHEQSRSEDVAYFDATKWTEAMALEARKWQHELGILVKPIRSRARVAEFPVSNVAPSIRPDGNSRNKPCWCGSGNKYKRCHGR